MSEIKCKVRVTRPVLTEQERERRMKEIRKAMVELARAVNIGGHYGEGKVYDR